ncbi:transposase [Cupriavidus taiwanensis]|uniref:Transposase n=2 Tax=Cupriavidus TaxID=106589 RepID=A0A375JF15_9BURK|nr:transposase [Cupriavidus taiwanensis]
MKQTDLGLNLSTKRTRKREFLDEMNRVVPWADLVMLIAPYAPEGKRGRPPFAVEAMLRIHFVQQWFGLSDPAMEEALHDVPLYREFAGLDNWTARLPDESTILRFRHLLEKHKLAAQILALVNDILRDKGLILRAGTVVDATLISAPSSTKNASGERDSEMHQSKKGNQWYFGMKAHIGVDAESGLVHTVRGKAGNVNDVIEANSLLHGEETDAFGDAGYQGVEKRPDARAGVNWHVAMKPGKRRVLDQSKPFGALVDQVERIKAGIRAKVEHPFRVIKRQFGYTKVRYRGLRKNTAPTHDLVRAVQLVDGARQTAGCWGMSAFLAHADASRTARECRSARAGQLRSGLIGWRCGAFSFLLNGQAHSIRVCAEHP